MEPLAELSTGLMDVTELPLAELRQNPTSRMAEQCQQIIDNLLVVAPPPRGQADGLFMTAYGDY